MAIFHGVEDTQYGTKALLDLQKGGGVKKYSMLDSAKAQTMQMAPNTQTFPVWAKDGEKPDEYPWIKGFSSTAPQTAPKKSYGGAKHEYDPRTFVSNVVGQAIAAGVLKEPSQIESWGQAAYKVITNLEKVPVPPGVNQMRQAIDHPQQQVTEHPPARFDDDIPY